MQNFTTRTPVARIIREGIHIAPDTRKLRQADYLVYLEASALRAQALEIVQNAEQQASEIIENARQQGLESGRSEAQRETIECVTELRSRMDGWIKATDEHLLELVHRCVGEVVNKVDTSAIVRESIEKGLLRFIEAQHICVRVGCVSTEDIETFVSGLVTQYGIVGHVRIIHDPSLKSNDVVIESPLGSVDLRVDQQLKVIEKALSA